MAVSHHTPALPKRQGEPIVLSTTAFRGSLLPSSTGVENRMIYIFPLCSQHPHLLLIPEFSVIWVYVPIIQIGHEGLPYGQILNLFLAVILL